MFFRNKLMDDPARYTEGVIVKLRSNGLVVHIPRYGIKGSVFLQRHDRSLAWMQPRSQKIGGVGSVFSVEWLAAGDASLEVQSYRQSIDGVTVRRGDRCQAYSLFDRVLLRIDASESAAHGLSLQLELAGKIETSAAEAVALATAVSRGDGGNVSRDVMFQVRHGDTVL